MSQTISIVLSVGLLIGVGAWLTLSGPDASEAPDLVQQKLAKVPKQIGPWQGTDVEVSEKKMRVAEAEAYLNRVYEHESGRESVSVMVLYGEPGALGAHDPKVCYAGTGFDAIGSPSPVSLDEQVIGAPCEVWNVQFEKYQPQKITLDVYWGWGVDGWWQASSKPRFDFVDRSRIFKIYCQQAIQQQSPKQVNSMKDFMQDFFRELKLTLSSQTS